MIYYDGVWPISSLHFFVEHFNSIPYCRQFSSKTTSINQLLTKSHQLRLCLLNNKQQYTHVSIMSRSRAPLLLGLTAAGGVGYYLYGAGGSPKVAEKQFEGELQLTQLTTKANAKWPRLRAINANGLETQNQPMSTRLPQK